MNGNHPLRILGIVECLTLAWPRQTKIGSIPPQAAPIRVAVAGGGGE